MPDRAHERRQNSHIRTLLANTAEGLIVVAADRTIRLLNEAASALLEIDRGSVVDTTIDSLGPVGLIGAIDRSLAGEPDRDPTIVEIGPKTLSCRATPVTEGGGAAVTIRDDSELLSQQERAEAILAGAGDGLVVFDPDSRVTFANPAALEMVGPALKRSLGKHVTINELLGVESPDMSELSPCWELRDCARIDCPEHGSRDLRCWLRCGTPGPDGTPQTYRDKRSRCLNCEVYAANSAAVGETAPNEAREITLGEPEHRILQVRTNPVVDRCGKYLGCVTSLHDVTAEREIAIMKNEFVSMVSHELRTPLTSIKGYVDLIVDGEAGEINDIQKEFLQIVQENSDRLVSLINDLLDISRIESGRVHLKVEPVDMAEVAQAVVETFRTMADQADVKLSWHAARGLPRAAGDRDRLGQVLMNLVSNGIKYSPGGGDVSVEVKRRGGEVVIEVTDTGIGIEPEDQKKLFSKFYRVDSTLTREIGGTGLGLSICKSVVELLGGRIGVRSTAGKGSTFWFSVPAAPVDLVRTPAIEGPLLVTGGLVLVIDRDPEVAGLIGTYLGKRGYDVLQAHSASEALDLALKHSPRAITLDVMLDDMDGFDLLNQLKQDERTASIPVVVLSIVCDEGKSLRLGAADYLEKPIDQGRLVDIIGGLVGSVGSPLVLVVDDDRGIVGALCAMLRGKGFAVASAYDGREAMAAVAKKKPDLVLLDLHMPVMDGYQVIQELKGTEETRDIPIVVMTAHRIDDNRIDVLSLTAGQVAKPFSLADLVERVERVLTPEAE